MIRKIYQKYGFIILLAYLIAAYFFMPLGIIAVICMLAPIAFALAGKGSRMNWWLPFLYDVSVILFAALPVGAANRIRSP